MRLAFLLFMLGFALGCKQEQVTNPTPNTFCAAVFSWPVAVFVNDSLSGLSVADSAYGVVQTGSKVEPLLRLASSPPRLVGGFDLGTYRAVVDRPGYREWTRDSIVVSQRQGPCGIIVSVQLTALLQRAP